MCDSYVTFIWLIKYSQFHCFSRSDKTIWPYHSDSKLLEIGMLVMGHSLIRSLVRSHRSLVRLLRTARFARALRCAHSFARSLTHSLLSSWDSGVLLSDFQSVLTLCVVLFTILYPTIIRKNSRALGFRRRFFGGR